MSVKGHGGGAAKGGEQMGCGSPDRDPEGRGGFPHGMWTSEHPGLMARRAKQRLGLDQERRVSLSALRRTSPRLKRDLLS